MQEEKDFLEMVQKQQQWNSGKANKCKKRLNTLRILQVILSALITFAVAILSDPECVDQLKYTVAVLGLLVAILEGLKNVFNDQDEWMNTRMTSEALKIELNHYKTKTKPYDQQDAFAIFVEKINKILKNSNSNWKTSMFDSGE